MQSNPLSTFPPAFQDYLIQNQVQGIRYIDDGEGGQKLYLPMGTDDLGSLYNEWQMPTVNGRKYFSAGATAADDPAAGGQIDPKLLAALQQSPGSIITLPDGRIAIDNDIASAWGRQNAQGGWMQNFLNGPGPVMLMGSAIGALGMGAAAGLGEVGAEAGSLGAEAGSSLPSSYWSMGAEAGGAASDAAPAAAGIFGEDAGGLYGANAGGANLFNIPGLGNVDLGAITGGSGSGEGLAGAMNLTGPLTTGSGGGGGLSSIFNGIGIPPGSGTALQALIGGNGPSQDGFNLLDPSTYGGSSSGGMPDWLKSLTGAIPGGTGNQSLLGSLLGTAAGTVPSALAFNWANNQKPDLSQLYETYNASKATNPWNDKLLQAYNAAGANTPALIQAAQRPLQQAQSMGYGDLLQSQAARGIRGSSFGDRDIGQYMNTTNTGIADAGLKAAQTSLALQGQLANYGASANNNNLALQGFLATRIPEAQTRNLAAMAPILGGSLSGIGNGLRSDSASNLGQWFSNLFSGY